MTGATQYIVNARTVVTIVVDDPTLTLDEYARHRELAGRPITADLDAFRDYLRGLGKHRYSCTAWDMWWDKFVEFQDHHDLLETQLFATDRYDDGEGLRRDPHFDACIG